MKCKGKEWEADMKNRPPIEIPMDWSNERAEAARLKKGSLGLERWGNRRMIRADPAYAADLREAIIGRREDPSEQAWTVGPLLRWMTNGQVERFVRGIPWAIEITLGTSKMMVEGMESASTKGNRNRLPSIRPDKNW